MNLLSLLIVVALALVMSWFGTYCVIKFAYKYGLYDKPNARKIHHEKIPRLGGVSFFPLGVIIIDLLSQLAPVLGVHDFPDVSVLVGLVPALLLLYVVGLIDDIWGVRYRIKFLFQAAVAILLCLNGYYYHDLYGLIGLHEVPTWLGWLVTVFMVIYVTNAFNFIDGIDGLSSGLAILTFAYFACFFSELGNEVFMIVCVIMPLILIPFMFYNVFGHSDKHTKVFMGDAGSLFLGLIFVILSIELSQHSVPEAGGDNFLLFSVAPLLLPLLDVIQVVVHRLRTGANPFQADKSHIHHRCMALGWTQHVTLFIVITFAVILTTLCYFLAYVLDINVVLAIVIVVWLVFNGLLSRKKINKNMI